jgi:hypothetical protein
LVGSFVENTINHSVALTIRDLTITNTGGAGILIANTLTLERVHIVAIKGLDVRSTLTARSITIDATGSFAVSLSTGASIDVDRASLKAAQRVIDAGNASGTNVLSGTRYFLGVAT